MRVAIVFALIVGILTLLALPVIAQEVAPDAGTFPVAAADRGVADPASDSTQAASLTAAVIDSGTARFAATMAFVASFVAGARRKFKRLREGGDGTKVTLMLLSLLFGALLGFVQLAPEVNAIGGTLGRVAGGVTAAIFVSFGVSLSARSRKASAQARVRRAVNPS